MKGCLLFMLGDVNKVQHNLIEECFDSRVIFIGLPFFVLWIRSGLLEMLIFPIHSKYA